ncbi:MAG TPA: hypothetical protein VGC30_00630 [Dokdonella sp.]
MRKTIPTLLASAFGACALAAGASAADAPTATTAAPAAAPHANFRQQFLQKIDTNGDGVISRAEYQAWVDGRFDKLDTNGDGRVDAKEIESSPATAEHVQKRADGFVQRFDQSGTGVVSKADFEAKEMARFDRLSNGGDSVTVDQLMPRRGAFHHRGAAPDADATPNAGD